MSITPLEYVKKEFHNTDKLSTEDWLRKMQEFSILQNSKIDLSHILEMSELKLAVLKISITSLYFADDSNYENSLFQVIQVLTQIEWESLDKEVIKSLYYLLNPIS